MLSRNDLNSHGWEKTIYDNLTLGSNVQHNRKKFNLKSGAAIIRKNDVMFAYTNMDSLWTLFSWFKCNFVVIVSHPLKRRKQMTSINLYLCLPAWFARSLTKQRFCCCFFFLLSDKKSQNDSAEVIVYFRNSIV